MKSRFVLSVIIFSVVFIVIFFGWLIFFNTKPQYDWFIFVCSLLGSALVVAIYLLSTISDDFHDELDKIRTRIKRADSPSDLVEIRNELLIYKRKAFSNHTHYNIDVLSEYINSRLKYDFKEK